MPLYEFEGKRPKGGETSFVDPCAVLIGGVTIGENCYIGPGAALRGGFGYIEIEDGSNVQENCVIHTFPDAKAMEDHMFGVDELARKARDYMEIVSMDIFGSPSEQVLNFIKQVAGSGVVVNIKPNWIGGYFRSITD